jgi:predicted phage terminase large subunit-like protein
VIQEHAPSKSQASSLDSASLDRLIALTTPRLNKYIPHEPHPKQQAFLLLNDIKEVLFGGAVGGGKSDALLMAALQYVDVPGYNALILRTSRAALKLPGGLIPRADMWLSQTDAVWREQDKQWVFPSGATLTFGYIEGPRDKLRYASSDYCFIGYEELTEFRRKDDYTFLFSRLRKPKHGPLADVPLRMRSTTNPVGPGFEWVKQRFVDTPNTVKRVFLPSTLEDNPSLDREEYLEALAELGPAVAEQLEKGIWKAVAKGDIFRREDFVLVSEPPAHVGQLIRYWDLAASEPTDANPNPAATAGVLMGLDKDKNPVVYDVRWGQLGSDAVEDLVARTAREDGKAVKVRISQDPGQAGKAQINAYVKLLAGFDVAGVIESGDKIVRAGPFSAQVRRRNCRLVAGLWVPGYLDEHEGFPTATLKDRVDASSNAYNQLVGAKPKLKINPNMKHIRR